MRSLLLLAIALLACKRSEPDRAAPAPSASSASGTLSLGAPRCTVGGTKPAFFVWIDTQANAPVTRLRATKFELKNASGAFVSGVADAIALRARVGANGQGDVKSLTGGLAAGDKVNLEIFGELALDAYGAGASYPTETRPFRAELESEQDHFVVTGTCEVGPAG